MQNPKVDGRFILYSPNIHTGGGLVLLQELLERNEIAISHCFVSKRVKDTINISIKTHLNFVGASFFSRFFGECRLKKISTPQDTILCFHGLPPLFTLSGKVVVFAQNRLLFDKSSLREYKLKTRLRMTLERFWVRIKHHSSIRYIVQTQSIASSVKKILGKECQVSILPFGCSARIQKAKDCQIRPINYDFVYIASGESHKNHLKLIEAWKILSQQGLKPSLALTINPQTYPNLVKTLEQENRHYNLNIINLGVITHREVLNLYASSGALIYPSTGESLGLPLIEAFQNGLPILASERDYVRDTVVPKETFDPDSAVSIARAVRRFLGHTEPYLPMQSAVDFLREVMR